MKKRVLALAMAVAMALSLLPTSAFADNDSTAVVEQTEETEESEEELTTDVCCQQDTDVVILHDADASAESEADAGLSIASLMEEEAEDDGIITVSDIVMTLDAMYAGQGSGSGSGSSSGGSGSSSGGSGTSSSSSELSASSYKRTAVVYYDTSTINADSTTGKLTSASVDTGSRSYVTNVTLNGTAVTYDDSTKTSGRLTATALGTYFPSVSNEKAVDDDSGTITITTVEGYYVTKVVVACVAQSNSTPYNCNTFSSGNAFQASFDVGTNTSTVVVDSLDFSHSSGASYYFILIEVAPIPSPLYVQYDYGDIVSILKGSDSSLASSSAFSSASTWLTGSDSNAYGTVNSESYVDGATGVKTNNTQYKYGWTNDSTEVSNWKHYANTVTDAAKAEAAAAGYYFAGWQATYYTTVTVTTGSNSDLVYTENYLYSFGTTYGSATYSEGDTVQLTTHVKLTAIWLPIGIEVTKTVTGLSGTSEANTAHTYTFQLYQQSGSDWVEYGNTFTLSVTGDGTASTIVSALPTGTYKVVETAGDENITSSTQSNTVYYITVTANGTATISTDALYNSSSSTDTTDSTAYPYTGTTSDGTSVLVAAGLSVTNAYSETKTGTLTVSKTVSDASSLATSGATYTVVVTANSDTVTNLSSVKVQNSSGNTVSATAGTSDGKATLTFTISANETITLSQLPLGTYTVEETSTGNYSKTYTISSTSYETAQSVTLDSSNTNAAIAITNTYPAVTLTGTKTWQDGETSTSHTNVSEVTLLVSRSVNGGTTESVTYDSSSLSWNGNSWTISGLPALDSNGQSYTYTVSEQAISGYDTAVTANSDGSWSIVNTRTAETTVSGTKTWVDGGKTHDNASEITLTLTRTSAKSGATEETVSASDYTLVWTGNTYTFSGLAMYDSEGYTYTYKVTETSVSASLDSGDSYEVTYDGYNITNTLTGTTSVTITKKWDGDEEVASSIRPASVEVYLYKQVGSGEKTLVGTYTVSGTSSTTSWTYTVENLPKYDENGKTITYTIAEKTSLSDYSTEVNGYTVTNTYPAKTSVNVEKVWDDENNQDGLRDDSTTVTVELYMDGVATGKTATLSSSEDWKATFTGLEKYELNADNTYQLDSDGNKIAVVYSIKETTSIFGYTASYSTSDNGTLVVTNTHSPATTKVQVTKVWSDDDNQDGKRPESVTVTLYANGSVTNQTATLSEDNNWKATFSELPEKSSGKTIVYSVEEATVSDYTTTYSSGSSDAEQTDGTVVDGAITITNTHVSETTSITVIKAWDHYTTKFNKTTDVTVTLYANGEAVENGEVTLTSANKTTTDDEEVGEAWSYTYTNLPVYAKGEKITYSVEETAVSGFTTTYSSGSGDEEQTDGTIVGNTITVTNTLDIGNLTITKVVVAPGTDTTSATFTFTISGAGFESLTPDSSVMVQIQAADGTVGEQEKYTAMGGSITVTISEGETILLSGIPVGNYTVAEGSTTGGFEWTTTYSAGGTETTVNDTVVSSTYTVASSTTSEDEEETATATNVTVTNTITGDRTITLYKEWDDQDDKYETRPDTDSFTVDLYQIVENEDGTYSLGTCYTASHWSTNETGDVWYTFQTLPVYDENGNILTYAVSEPKGADGYTLSDAENGRITTSSGESLETAEIEGTTYYVLTPAKNTELVYSLVNTLETGTIKVTKTVVDEEGNLIESTEDSPLTFMLTLTAYEKVESEDDADASDAETGTDEGDEAADTATYVAATDSKGDAITFSLEVTSGETATFKDLPLGYYWTLSEVSTSTETKNHSYSLKITGLDGTVTRTYVKGDGWFNTYSYIYLNTTDTIEVAIENVEQTTTFDVDMTAFPLAQKILTSEALDDEEDEMEMTFYFVIYGSASEYTPCARGTATVTANADTVDEDGNLVGRVKWNYQDENEFTYNTVGTYYYTIHEVSRNSVEIDDELIQNIGGINYDDTVYTLVITVYIDEDETSETFGELTASYNVYLYYGTDDQTEVEKEEYEEDQIAKFYNSYEPGDTSYLLSVEKVLEGRDLVANEFSINVEEYTDDTFTTKAEGTIVDEDETEDKSGDETEDESENEIVTVNNLTLSNDANGQFSAELVYTSRGTYYYKISEVQGTTGGMTYDTNEYYVKVVVKSSGATETGNAGAYLVVDSVYYKTSLDGEWVEYTYDATVDSEEENGVNPLVFTNTYEANGEANLVAYKTLSGRTLNADEFSFIVIADANVPMPEGAVLATEDDAYVQAGYVTAGQYYIIATNDADGTIDFGTVTYSEAAIDESYTYTVREIAGELNGVTYDGSTYYIYVTVSDAGNGALSTSVKTTGTKDRSGDSVADVVFTNSFSQGSVSISGKKTWVNGGKTYSDEDGNVYTNADLITLVVYYEDANGNRVEYARYTSDSKNLAWDDNGSWTIANLPQYDKEGNTYSWSVDEIIDGEKVSDAYDISVSYNEETGLWELTNTIQQDKVILTGTKTWVEPEEKTHDNATEITLTVKRSDGNGEAEEVVDESTYSVHWEGNTYTISGLDKYNDQGFEYRYIVSEALSEYGEAVNAGYTSDEEVTIINGTNGQMVYYFVNRAPDEDPSSEKVVSAITNADGTTEVVVQDADASTDDTLVYNDVAVGDEITYTITYYNNTNDTATVIITDILDEGVDYVSATVNSEDANEDDASDANGVVYDSDAHTVTWTIADVEAFTTGTVTLTVKVNENARTITEKESEATVENQATVTVGTGNESTTKLVVNPVEDDESEDPTKEVIAISDEEATETETVETEDGTVTTYGEVSVGDEITYEISYYNNTNERVEVVFYDALAESVALVDNGTTAGYSYDKESGVVSWTVSAEPFTTVSVTLVVKVTEAAKDATNDEGVATVENQATVQVGEISNKTNIVVNPLTDDEPENPTKAITAVSGKSTAEKADEADATTDADENAADTTTDANENEAEEAVAEVSEETEVSVGDILTYEISYYNHYNALTNVVITDTLDEGVDFVAASNDGVYDEATHTVTWTLENVTALSAGSVTVQVQVNANAKIADEDGNTSVANQASVAIGNNSAVDTNIVENPLTDDGEEDPEKVISADSKGADGASVSVGDEITYVISYYNNNSKAAKIVIEDALDAGVDFVEASDNGVYDKETHTVTWTFDSVAAFTAGTVTVTVAVNENATVAKVVSNDASVTIGNTTRTTNEVTTDVDDNPEDPVKAVDIDKDGVYDNADEEVAVGDTIAYQISYYNNLSSRAEVVIEDTLDAGVTFVSASDDGVYNAATHTVTWTIEAEAYAKGTVTLKVTVNSNALLTEGDETASIVNSATVKVGNQDEVTTNEVENPIPSDDPKDPVKAVDTNGDGVYDDADTYVAVGDTVTYQISYYNNLNKAATVVIKDKLDKGVTLVSVTGDATYNTLTRTITWTIDNVSAFTEGTVYVTVTVNDKAENANKGEDEPAIQNTATVKVGNQAKSTTNTVELLVEVEVVNDPPAVQTSDTNRASLWMITLVAALLGLTGATGVNRRNRRRR